MDIGAPNTLTYLAYVATWSSFVATAAMLSRVDFREHRLPNTLVATGYLCGLLGFTIAAFSRGELHNCSPTQLLGSLITVLGYLMIHLLGGNGNG